MKKKIDLEKTIFILEIILAPIYLMIMFIIEFFKAQFYFINECYRITCDNLYQIYFDIKHKLKRKSS